MKLGEGNLSGATTGVRPTRPPLQILIVLSKPTSGAQLPGFGRPIHHSRVPSPCCHVIGGFRCGRPLRYAPPGRLIASKIRRNPHYDATRVTNSFSWTAQWCNNRPTRLSRHTHHSRPASPSRSPPGCQTGRWRPLATLAGPPQARKSWGSSKGTLRTHTRAQSHAPEF